MAYEGAKTGQAQSLRSRMTAAERRLWSKLRNRRFYGLLWSRQEPFGDYVVDFYCAAARLVVELDGDSHNIRPERDRVRQAWLEEKGVKVVRFPNWVVLNETDRCLDDLLVYCLQHIPKLKREGSDGSLPT